MPLVPMRLLLDHAAENDYGLARVQRQQHGADPGHHGSGPKRPSRRSLSKLRAALGSIRKMLIYAT